MDLIVNKTSAANDERQEKQQEADRRARLRERRKSRRDRRRSVNDGVSVSLSVKSERRNLPDRRRNRAARQCQLPESSEESKISTLV